MQRIGILISVLAVLLMALPASAFESGPQWWTAFKSGKGAQAAKVTVTSGFRYGDAGKVQVMSANIGTHLTKVFRAIKPTFRAGDLEEGSCTSVGRELGYMSNEWRDVDASVAEWIRKIPEDFCGGNSIEPPTLWLVKILDGDVPHAIVLVRTGEEDLITAFYHF